MLIHVVKKPAFAVTPILYGSTETNHICVNNVRFWAMVAIVAVHSLLAWDISGGEELTKNLQVVLIQSMKFGTIAFYFISGFLLGQRLEHHAAHSYFLRRLKSVGAPWALWTSLFVLLPFTKRIILDAHSTNGTRFLVELFWARLLNTVLFSPYWFIPNFLFALALILLCKRYLQDLRFGAALLCISFLYGVNIYRHWIITSHTTALGGFVFYLWLGHWVACHEEAVFRTLARWKSWQMVATVVITGIIAATEAQIIGRHHPDIMMNTLRISNQVFSLSVVAALLSIRRVTWPHFVDVRANTFGLFLIHPLIQIVLYSFVRSETYQVSPWIQISRWGVTFLVFYGGSLILTRALVAWPSLAWTVGQWNQRKDCINAKEFYLLEFASRKLQRRTINSSEIHDPEGPVRVRVAKA